MLALSQDGPATGSMLIHAVPMLEMPSQNRVRSSLICSLLHTAHRAVQLLAVRALVAMSEAIYAITRISISPPPARVANAELRFR